MDTIGLICEPDHPVFGPVGERLSARGFDVAFVDPGDPIERETVDDVAALASGVVGPEAFAALRYADRTGVPTWNGFFPTTALSCRLVALHALAQVGCRVPRVWFDEPEADTVPRTRYRWVKPRRLDDAGDFYQEKVRTCPIDYRYHAVDDGRETHVRAMIVRSHLTGTASVIEDVEVDVQLAATLRELLDRFETRALSVDFVPATDGFYAVDLNPAPTFVGADMDLVLADSLASLTTIGA